MTDWSAHVANYERIESRDTQAAYFALVISAERAGFTTLAKTKGKVWEVQIRSEIEQPFAFTVNRAHLLFYLRKPALMAAPTLRDQAFERFGALAKAAPNSGNEATVEIQTAQVAQQFCDWLFPSGCGGRRSA